MDLERRGLLRAGIAASVLPVVLDAPAVWAQAGVGFGPIAPGDPSESLRLWPSMAPGGEGVNLIPEEPERSTDPAYRDRYARYTTDPTLTVVRPERPNGSALLLVPGGGYRWSVLDKEGFEVARVFAASGTTCFVLKYRLPADGWTAGPDAPLQDVQRALRLIRHHAADYNLRADRIALLGASAGGHLAGLASHRTDPTYQPIDTADALSFRPDLTLLMYPVVTMTEPHLHLGSRQHLLGPSPDAGPIAAYSLEQADWRGAAPVFILHSMDDAVVPVENSLMLMARLKADGVKVETHLFEEGGHGFGVRLIKGRPAEVWPEQARTWAARLDFAL